MTSFVNGCSFHPIGAIFNSFNAGHLYWLRKQILLFKKTCCLIIHFLCKLVFMTFTFSALDPYLSIQYGPAVYNNPNKDYVLFNLLWITERSMLEVFGSRRTGEWETSEPTLVHKKTEVGKEGCW